MRHLQVIEAEKTKLSKQAETLEESKKNAYYKTPSSEIFPAIRAYIWMPIAAFLALAFGYSVFSDKKPVYLIAVFSAGFLVLSLIAVVRYLSERNPLPVSIIFFILSVAALTAGGAGILYLLRGESLTITLFPDFIKEFESAEYIKSFYYCDAVVILIAGIMTIGTLVRILQETGKKKQASAAIAYYNKQIEETKKNLSAITEEYDRTRKELSAMYQAEVSKSAPDINRMTEIGNFGWESASKWVADKKRSDDLAQAKAVYIAAMKNGEPDTKLMEEAAELGDPNANMWSAKRKMVDFFANLDDYVADEYRTYFEGILSNLKKAEGCQDIRMRELCLIVANDICSAHGGDLKNMPTKEENLKAISMLREMKRSEAVTGDERLFVERALSVLVDTMDALAKAEKEEEEAQRRELSERRSSFTVRRCRYDACGVCTLKSTSVSKFNCHYSPGAGQLSCMDYKS